MRRAVLLAVLAVLMAGPAQAQGGFRAFLESVAQEAVQQGVSQQTVRRALETVELDESVIELDRKQPEGKITFARYLRNVITQQRIDKGRRLAAEYAGPLRQVQAAYGVPAGVVIALWAIESSYGANQGGFDVLSSLATLAYEGRRADFFRGELIEALKILQEENLAPSALTGSWAGALGQCQFMPSTYRKYAVDADGDGHRDIWGDDLDAIASIARYLAAEGWQAGASWGQEVVLTKEVAESETGLDVALGVEAWRRRGVQGKGKPLPQRDISASLILPDGAGGRAFLVYDNFRALMRWNRSTYFATSVGLLADLLSNGS